MQLLSLLAMPKYERLLPRLFPGAARFEIRDSESAEVWALTCGNAETCNGDKQTVDIESRVWSDLGGGIECSKSSDETRHFRTSLRVDQHGSIGWLIVVYDAQTSTPMSSALKSLRRAFADAAVFILEEIALQSECNQLAAELTERYEELNLVYNTKDQIELFEEGHEALVKLVHNCADYLNVGLAALICRDRGLVIHETNGPEMSADIEAQLEALSTRVYDWVEAQIQPVVLNDTAEKLRKRIFTGRSENLLAHPIVDDHGTAIGILAVTVHERARVFSNGDRNLLEVMAKKAARIIYTHHDSLTGLINRSGFEASFATALTSARSKNFEHCLLHINIDKLHVVNDLLGHAEGDNLIRRVGKLLRGSLRETDILSRLDGDEFAVLLMNRDISKGQKVAEKIREAAHELKVVSANRQLDVTISIGVVPISRDTESIVSAMTAAEIACKDAKEKGQDRIQVFVKDNTLLMRRSEEIEWIGRIQQALHKDKFLLYSQPVLPITDSKMAEHFEILLRMYADDGEILSPAVFLPAAERYQLMPMVDRWVIRQTLKTLVSNWDSIAGSEAIFCINLSGQSLTNPGFQAFVLDELEQGQIDPHRFCFEITETAAISNIDEAMSLIEALREIGCRFALDDFGAGLSSFGYLKVLPVDYLKIDGSFVREITKDTISRAMVEAMSRIGRTMGLTMIAEFVGDDATLRALREIGVEYGQGFYLGKPAQLSETIDRVRKSSPAVSA